MLFRRSNKNSSPEMEKPPPCQVHFPKPEKIFCASWLAKFPTRSKRIDVISRNIFPMVFEFFNVAYWSTYLYTDEASEDKPKST